ncbi:tRNA lysidine(34) synthetase TilS [Rhodobacteraceae bacterium 2CG4]|uniref:tRNA(Ile)-lysidine synthase n=1 Tax=Halovulum marinum TaxID=2662447 RepID=A0A6L5YW07_9RHOB|nr:tRNA lysidine(34) synthetase TilS [Halovulum marinum]MSU88407.1 tRNA lysidine(34) synthetase TilS [Halovulum marinum]
MAAGTVGRRLAAALAAIPGGPLGVAVSGGGDSLALMVLLAECAEGRPLRAVTVDHGLRPDSAAEARQAADAAARLGIAHDILPWTDRPSGNLQDAARRARRALIGGWAARHRIGLIALGHTRDDQAETFLLRLARGSGLYGLTGMKPVQQAAGVTWVRPLLSLRREALRDELRARGLDWAEDPGNRDPRFDRARLRAAMPELDRLGLGVERLAETAAALDRAARVVRAAVAELARSAAEPSAAGYLRLDRARLRAAEPELRLRLLAEALRWVSGADYTPRLAQLQALDAWAWDDADAAPARRTLHGCVVERGGGSVTVLREAERTGPAVPAGQVWDGRWGTGPAEPGVTVAALGEAGLAELPDWRATGHPRLALAALPAFRRRGALIAAPFALPREPCHAWLLTEPGRFLAALGPS